MNERLARNAESKRHAERDGEGWTEHELEVLMLCSTDADFVDMAELVGRTIEACRQKFYITRRDGVTTSSRTSPAPYRGWTCDMGDE
jgi:hypothetical protein